MRDREALRRNAYDNTTILITTVNAGMLPFFYNFMHYLQSAGVQKFIVVAEDSRAYHELLLCYRDHLLKFDVLFNETYSAAYKSDLYNKIVSRRPSLLLSIMELGFNVLYTDVDVVWRANIVQKLACTGHYDIAVQSDEGGMCTGLMLLCRSGISLHILETWKSRLERPTINQAAFDSIVGNSNAKVLKLNRLLYQSGKEYFDRGTNRSVALTIHNNWIVGSGKKIERFERMGLWAPTRGMELCPG